MPQHDDHDDLAALDFSAYEPGSGDDGAAESDALDFSVANDGGEESAVDALGEYAPAEPEDGETELDAIAAATEAEEQEEDEEQGRQMFTVINPPETVSVSALMDGRTERVRLLPKATNMTESELADEILVLADLARQNGLAGQHTYLHSYLQDNPVLEETLSESGELGELGLDVAAVGELMDTFRPLPTPEQADAAQAEVFATRYAADK